LKRAAALAFAGLAFGGALVAAPSATAATTIPTCTYSYTVQNQWPGGFAAQLTIGYSLGAVSSGWAAGFDFVSPGQHVSASWNSNINQYGSHVALSPSPYAPQSFLPQSGTVSVSFMGSYSTVNPNPANVTFDGVSCSAYTLNA
jgi:endoglucanase